MNVFDKYPEFYTWTVDWMEDISNLIDFCFDSYSELWKLPNMIKDLVEDKWIDLSEKIMNEFTDCINNLENDIFVWENIVDENLEYASFLCNKKISDRDYKWESCIRMSLFQKFIPIFYSLFWDEKLEVISYSIKKLVANSINKKENWDYHFITKDSIYTIFQTIDWDLHIKKYKKYQDSMQLDLFDEKINDNDFWCIESQSVEWEIYIYQYPDSIFQCLLEYCFINEYFPYEIWELKNINWLIPNAADAFDINRMWERMFKNNLEWSERIIPYVISTLWDITYYCVIKDGNIDIQDRNNNIKLSINEDEIWKLLKALLCLPWRSVMDMKNSLDIFMELWEKRKKWE